MAAEMQAVHDHWMAEGMKGAESVTHFVWVDGHQVVLIFSLETQSKKSLNKTWSVIQEVKMRELMPRSQPQLGLEALQAMHSQKLV